MTTHTTSITLLSQPVEVSVSSKRSISNALANIKAGSPVVGLESTRVLAPVESNIKAVSGQVTGVSTKTSARVLTAEGDLHCDESKVESFVYGDSLSQDAMHTQRLFVIRKNPIRTIFVRQTPTKNTQ